MCRAAASKAVRSCRSGSFGRFRLVMYELDGAINLDGQGTLCGASRLGEGAFGVEAIEVVASGKPLEHLQGFAAKKVNETSGATTGRRDGLG